MDAHQNLAVRLGVAFYMYQKSLLDIALCQLMLYIDKRERRKPRSCWAKSWIQQRPLHGHYDALIPEPFWTFRRHIYVVVVHCVLKCKIWVTPGQSAFLKTSFFYLQTVGSIFLALKRILGWEMPLLSLKLGNWVNLWEDSLFLAWGGDILRKSS